MKQTNKILSNPEFLKIGSLYKLIREVDRTNHNCQFLKRKMNAPYAPVLADDYIRLRIGEVMIYVNSMYWSFSQSYRPLFLYRNDIISPETAIRENLEHYYIKLS